jgi:predicted porin
MKKILLGTSALVALFAGAAQAAETPKVTLGGISNFEGGVESGNDLKAVGERSGAFRTDNVITVKVDGKTDAGLGYGARIDLEADTSNNVDNAGVNAERTFIYVDGKWGKLQGGSDLGVTKTMKVDASSLARATGGIDGDFTYFFTAGAQQVFATPDLYLDYGAGITGDESLQTKNKISYYTPRISGFQAGVSYLPDSSINGQNVTVATRTAGAVRNIVLGALNYEGKFSNVGVNVGVTGEYGSAENTANNNLRTYQAGAKVSYMGASLAGSYANLSDSLRAKGTSSDSSNYIWTLGAAYEVGAFGASVTYLHSNYDNAATTANKFSNISVGADYKLAAGLTPYAEVNFIDYNSSVAGQDNKDTVGIIGTQLAF